MQDIVIETSDQTELLIPEPGNEVHIEQVMKVIQERRKRCFLTPRGKLGFADLAICKAQQIRVPLSTADFNKKTSSIICKLSCKGQQWSFG